MKLRLKIDDFMKVQTSSGISREQELFIFYGQC